MQCVVRCGAGTTPRLRASLRAHIRWLQRQLAALDSASRQYPSAAGFYRRATQLDPRDKASWNQLGYTEALRRDLSGARGALEEYLRLAPQDPNASDSLGDVNFYLGACREAERNYLEAYRKDRAFAGGGSARIQR